MNEEAKKLILELKGITSRTSMAMHQQAETAMNIYGPDSRIFKHLKKFAGEFDDLTETYIYDVI